MPRTVAVSIEEKRLQLEEASVRELMNAVDAFGNYPVPAGSIDIAFVDVENCSRLHSDFFGDPDPTDVMTFPGDPDDGHAGDIAVCPHVAAEASVESGLDFNRELSLYIIHACLHLAGLEDNTSENTALMRQAESELMAFTESRNAFLRCNWMKHM